VPVSPSRADSALSTPKRPSTCSPSSAIPIPPAHHADPPPTPELGRPPAVTAEPVTATAAGAHLSLLGGCHLTIDGQPVHLRRTASLQILAYLAVHPHGATSHDLTHAIWPHLPAATIRQRLHTTLSDLRQQLRPPLGEDPVTRGHDHYRLNTHAISTDLQPWRTAVHALTHAVGTTAQHHACRDIVELYRGEFAAGHTWPWLTPAREQTRRTVIDACTTLAEHGEGDQALAWLQRAIAIDPDNEHLHHRVAAVLSDSGDTAGAADLIDRFHRRLADPARTTF
jgi:DNA-binding SARP family transcriptional activator